MPVYFTPEFFRFLTRLKRNNNRDWFLAHKNEYEALVHQPALQFITDFAAPLYKISPYLVADARPSRGSLFRIYRDTRFSHDKRPYKTHVAMRFSHRGKNIHSPGFYLHLDQSGCFAASGLWHPEPPTLLKVRNAIVERAEEWRKVRKLLNWDDAAKLSRPPARFPLQSRIRRGPEVARFGHGRRFHAGASFEPEIYDDVYRGLQEDVTRCRISEWRP